jgi:hypothetical protein
MALRQARCAVQAESIGDYRCPGLGQGIALRAIPAGMRLSTASARQVRLPDESQASACTILNNGNAGRYIQFGVVAADVRAGERRE